MKTIITFCQNIRHLNQAEVTAASTGIFLFEGNMICMIYFRGVDALKSYLFLKILKIQPIISWIRESKWKGILSFSYKVYKYAIWCI
jgi:hypothetical protein